MQKRFFLLASVFLASSFAFGAQTVTSTLQGSRLDFIAKEGSVVKKGNPLVKFGTSSTMDKIASAKAILQGAEVDLKNKTEDLKRYSTLKETNAASQEKLDKADLEWDFARFNVMKYDTDVKSLEAKLTMAVIAASYDCKVTKVLIATNSGTDYGQKIMEIEPVGVQSAVNSADTPSQSNIRTVTSTMYGCVVATLVQEGQTVKKGELLAKLVNPVSDIQVEGLKHMIAYAEHAVETAKRAYDRYSKLKGKSISIEFFEQTELAYEKAKYELAYAKVKLAFTEVYILSGIIKAPFDCKVTKVIMFTGDGAEAGSPIMEITPITQTSVNNSLKDSLSVTSVLDEYDISYLPEEGQTVKKGELLMKLDHYHFDYEIDMAKLDLDYAVLNCTEKEKEFRRCKYLADNKANSIEECGNSELAYGGAKADVDDCKAKLSFCERKKNKSEITAPYDCKVTKVYLIVGGGVKWGTPVLEIEPIKQ